MIVGSEKLFIEHMDLSVSKELILCGIMKKEKDLEYNPNLHKIIHEVIENQIREGKPKETKETLKRLMNLGYNRHEAIHKIGIIVIDDIYNMLKNEQEFNEKQFAKKLLALK